MNGPKLSNHVTFIFWIHYFVWVTLTGLLGSTISALGPRWNEWWELSLSLPSFLTMYWGLKLSSVAHLIPSLNLWLSLGGNNGNTWQTQVCCFALRKSSYIPVLQTILGLAPWKFVLPESASTWDEERQECLL